MEMKACHRDVSAALLVSLPVFVYLLCVLFLLSSETRTGSSYPNKAQAQVKEGEASKKHA